MPDTFITFMLFAIVTITSPGGAATFAAAALTSLSLWCLGGALLAQVLTTDTQWRLVNRSLAVLLVVSIAPLRVP